MKLTDADAVWIEALRPYMGERMVPIYPKPDGTLDQQATIDQFCLLHGVKRLDAKGATIG